MQNAGLGEMEPYTSRRNNMVSQFIVTRLILDLCLDAEQQPVVRVAKGWR